MRQEKAYQSRRPLCFNISTSGRKRTDSNPRAGSGPPCLKGDEMAIENTLERLKREKLEIEKKAQESNEERTAQREKMKQAGRDTFDKDLDNISYETLDGLVHRSDSATISLVSTRPSGMNETALDILRSALGKQLSSV